MCGFGRCRCGGDIDSDACREYNVWESDPAGARYMQGPGELDKLWILDVEGEVPILTVTVSNETAAPESAVERLTGTVEWVDFISRS